MTVRNMLCGAAVLAIVLAAGPGRAGAQGFVDDRVYRYLTAEQLEDMLASYGVGLRKSENFTQRNVYDYDFKRDGIAMRLTYYDGKDLALESVFARNTTLDRINEWNAMAKFSRASLGRDAAGSRVVLRHNLDVIGGVTRGTVRQFINQFAAECKNFDRFLSSTTVASPEPKTTPPPVTTPPSDQKIHLPITDNTLERVLSNLNVQFRKQAAPSGITVYDFDLEGFKLRLSNYGGKDLMIDAIFRKVNVTALNKYNVDRKFIRAVAYKATGAGGTDYTALESNLDCAAGVTDEMIRHFITAFVQDVRHFSNYLSTQQ